jgi:hypothetical protein
MEFRIGINLGDVIVEDQRLYGDGVNIARPRGAWPRGNPDFLPAHAFLAVLFTEMGQTRRAQEAWEQARRLSPGAAPVHLRQRLPYRRPADLDRFLGAVAKLQ